MGSRLLDRPCDEIGEEFREYQTGKIPPDVDAEPVDDGELLQASIVE